MDWSSLLENVEGSLDDYEGGFMLEWKNILALFTCHNRIEKTKACIKSICSLNENVKVDFIVADDASTDGTRTFLESCDNVTVVSCDGKAYYSGGMRAAINEAKRITSQKYDFVLLLNDDFICDADAISRMIEFYYEVGDGSIIVGSTYGDDGELTYSGVVKISKVLPRFRKLDILDSNRSCDTFNANIVLIPFDVFAVLPNIDSAYVHSLGDFDYGLTASRLGYKIYATPFWTGYCNNDHNIKGSWMDVSLPRIERFRKKERPLGQPIGPWFYFLCKNYNIFTAMAYVLNDYIKILIGK